jgi:hypothetical protein
LIDQKKKHFFDELIYQQYQQEECHSFDSYAGENKAAFLVLLRGRACGLARKLPYSSYCLGMFIVRKPKRKEDRL